MDYSAIKNRLSEREIGCMEGTRPCAVLVPIEEENGEPCLLYEVRAASLRYQPGDICFPGGRMERGEDAAVCALRELTEELGITQENVELLGALDYTFHISGAPIYPVLARVNGNWRKQAAPNRAEVDEVFTIPLHWLTEHPPTQVFTDRFYRATQPVSEEIRTLLEGRARRERNPVLFWNYQGRLLWGMTARVTNWLIKWLAER